MAETTKKALELSEPFRPQPVRFLELWEQRGWRLKVYGISRLHQRPTASLVAAAKRVAAQCLRSVGDHEDSYGVGFVDVHEGREANFVFVNWWSRESELHRHVYRSAPDDPEALQQVRPTASPAPFGTCRSSGSSAMRGWRRYWEIPAGRTSSCT